MNHNRRNGESRQRTGKEGMTTALQLAAVMLIGTAIIVSLEAKISFAYTLPVAAIVFCGLVVILFCWNSSSNSTVVQHVTPMEQQQQTISAPQRQPINVIEYDDYD